MPAIKIIFWISLFIIMYSYLLYGLLIWIIIKFKNVLAKKNDSFDKNFIPGVTLLIAAYNEGAVIKEKIKNSLELNYPKEKLTILFITDGSDDNSNEIINSFRGIQLLYQPKRRGKVAAINRAMEFVTTPFVIFCDANTQLNKDCVLEIIKHYKDPNVGAVAGEKIVREPGHSESIAGAGEGLYWKYESFLKKLDSEFYSVVGAAGELFSIRTNLNFPVPESVLLDDFIISLKIAQQGYRVVYEPNAYAIESPSSDIREEQKRKIRIGAGGFQSIVMLRSLLNIFKYPKLSFQYISHRVLRWAVCPFLLPVILITNAIIYFKSYHLFYGVLLAIQVVFYLFALAGYFQAIKNKKSRFFYIPYYFVFMNVSLYLGLARFLGNRQSVLWEKAQRKSEEISTTT